MYFYYSGIKKKNNNFLLHKIFTANVLRRNKNK